MTLPVITMTGEEVDLEEELGVGPEEEAGLNIHLATASTSLARSRQGDPSL